MLRKLFFKKMLSTLGVSIAIVAFLVGCGQQGGSQQDSNNQQQEDFQSEPESDYEVDPEEGQQKEGESEEEGQQKEGDDENDPLQEPEGL